MTLTPGPISAPHIAADPSDYRVLVLVPTRRDGRVSRDLLGRAHIATACHESALSLAADLAAGVGALLMTDAAFGDPHFGQLLTALGHQPSWSDIPVVLLCQLGASAPAGARLLASLRNVTVLERPTSARTLLSSVQAALRARARQYQLREQIEALHASEAALLDADHRKDVFLATLAHELRNPLAPIRHAAHILASPRLAPHQLQWAQNVIKRQATHMALLLDDLLDIARITQGKLELKKRRVRLTEIVDAAVEAARPLIESKHHQLTITLPPEDLTLDADPLRLSQILSNLLTNAAKYTDPTGQIELVGSLENGSTLCLSVTDDGIGITSEALARIFQMFSQIDGASARSEGGLGIGLSLVKGLVELHGGKIVAHSKGSGQGSTFAVRLPLNASAFIQATATDAGTRPPPATGRRVLVAEDNRDVADTLAMLLDQAGHDVRVAYGGHAALAIAQAFRPEVAILDIGMPTLSGYEVAQELRRQPWGAGIYLVALTGWGGDDDQQRAIRAGFDRHLTKPVDPGALDNLLVRTAEAPAPH